MLPKCLVWITDFDIILVIEGLGNNSTKVGLAEELVSLCAIGLARPACSQHVESPQFLLTSADEDCKKEFSMLLKIGFLLNDRLKYFPKFSCFTRVRFTGVIEQNVKTITYISSLKFTFEFLRQLTIFLTVRFGRRIFWPHGSCGVWEKMAERKFEIWKF